MILTSSAIAALTLSGAVLADMNMEHMEKMGNDAVKRAIETNDFTAFQTATKDLPMAVVDTQAEFDQVVAMHAKMKAAHEEMKALHTELELPEMKKDEKHEKHDMKDMKGEMKKSDWKAGKMNIKEKKKMSEAITTGTYEQFVASIPDENPLLSFVTKENFSVLQELVDARKAGDSAKVKALALQLGMDKTEVKHVRKMIKK